MARSNICIIYIHYEVLNSGNTCGELYIRKKMLLKKPWKKLLLLSHPSLYENKNIYLLLTYVAIYCTFIKSIKWHKAMHYIVEKKLTW